MQFAKCQFWLGPRHRLRFEIFASKFTATITASTRNTMIYCPRICWNDKNWCNYPLSYSNSSSKSIEVLMRRKNGQFFNAVDHKMFKCLNLTPKIHPTGPHVSAIFGETGQDFEIPSKACESAWNLLPKTIKPKIWSETPPYRLNGLWPER